MVTEENRNVVIDACVLYPTVLREIMLGLAQAGLFEPVWSPQILNEWRHAAIRNHPDQEDFIIGEIASVAAIWQDNSIMPDANVIDRLILPDPDDRHVLATAIEANAPIILTLNLKDFPRRVLTGEGVTAIHPDAFAWGLLSENENLVCSVVETVRIEAERLSGQNWPVRKLLKKARMPRLGKALG